MDINKNLCLGWSSGGSFEHVRVNVRNSKTNQSTGSQNFVKTIFPTNGII